ncbi:MAG: Asp-tRNA(Asn)/Glu-tRNA(Gln) amidotransferase subunit GatB [Actinobacteria bacterium]|nr:Asp-tRNA(Asn)/Glu-tRNA(Gln) amidotransferase subunit GatB [Actinomycetota bacterium]
MSADIKPSVGGTGEIFTTNRPQQPQNPALPDGWEMILGLEVHAELLTHTKLFSASLNEFGGDPNTNIDPVTLGLPGALPVLNRHAVELAIRTGLALNCTVGRSVFARKNYFYPDMPKGFQISQYDLPINRDGWLELPDGTRIGIERAHLEEDTGKSSHMGGESGRIHDAQYSLIDFNRAGVPLLEIVSRPDLRTADEAKDYVAELRDILVAVGASDGKMEEGSMRVDCNVSVRRIGEGLGTRCEIKNVNSLRSLGRAIDYEARRQIDMIEAGEAVEQETRHWNDGAGRTSTLRSKETATDYRYFPEPDLVAVDPGQEWIDAVRAALPMLPRERRVRLVEATGIGATSAAIIVTRGLDDLVVDAVAAGGDGPRAATHAEHNLGEDAAERLSAANFAALTTMEVSGAVTATQAKTLLGAMLERGVDAHPADIAAELGFEAMDNSELEGLIDGLIADNPNEFQRFCDGDGKVMGFFVGAVMKATQGKADGKAVTAILNSRKP